MADLAALESEFDSVEIDLEEQLIGVTTGPIELEAVYLGPFRIVLHWQRIGRGRAYEIEAIEPNAAEGRRQMQCAKLIRQSH